MWSPSNVRRLRSKLLLMAELHKSTKGTKANRQEHTRKLEITESGVHRQSTERLEPWANLVIHKLQLCLGD